jgi:hypothetical protein
VPLGGTILSGWSYFTYEYQNSPEPLDRWECSWQTWAVLDLVTCSWHPLN